MMGSYLSAAMAFLVDMIPEKNTYKKEKGRRGGKKEEKMKKKHQNIADSVCVVNRQLSNTSKKISYKYNIYIYLITPGKGERINSLTNSTTVIGRMLCVCVCVVSTMLFCCT